MLLGVIRRVPEDPLWGRRSVQHAKEVNGRPVFRCTVLIVSVCPSHICAFSTWRHQSQPTRKGQTRLSANENIHRSARTQTLVQNHPQSSSVTRLIHTRRKILARALSRGPVQPSFLLHRNTPNGPQVKVARIRLEIPAQIRAEGAVAGKKVGKMAVACNVHDDYGCSASVVRSSTVAVATALSATR